MRLAMTGITSGVGMRLAAIALARGDEVTGLVRSPDRADAKDLARLGARIVAGDLDARGAMIEAFRGADAVLHLAAHVGDHGPRELFEHVNVDGTRSAIQATAEAEVKRFVHLSSSAVYGRPDHGRVTEDWPTRKIGLPYEDTKTDAENLAFERGRELGIGVAAIRPPIIYGPNDRNFMPRALEALRARRFLLIDGGRAPLNVVFVDHVADVALRAAQMPAAIGEAFNVMDEVDRRPPSVREVAETIAREAGLPRPRLSLPFPVAMAAAHIVERAHNFLNRPGAPPISPFVVRILTRDVVYDSGKAARILGWKPQLTALEGLARAAREAAGRT